MKTALLNFAKSFLANLKTILFAFVLAVIIWIAISFQIFPNVPRTIPVPVSAQLPQHMLDSNLKLDEEFEESLDVLIEGKRFDISKVDASDFYVYLDFSAVRNPGTYAVPIEIEKRSDSNFAITSRNLTRTLKVIQTDEKVMPITADAQDVVAGDGTIIDYANIRVNVEEIKIWGEKSLVDSVKSVQVSAVSDKPILFTTFLRGELVLLDKDGNRVTDEEIYIDDRSFLVYLPVFKQKTLPLQVGIDVPGNFALDSLRGRMSIEPKEVTISELLEEAYPNPFIEEQDQLGLGTIALRNITLSNLQNGFDIPITMPNSRCRNMSIIDRAKLTFTNIGDYREREFNISSANFTVHTPQGYSVNYITRQVSVKVVGPYTDFLRGMVASDITGTIDLRGISENSSGRMTVKVDFTIAGDRVLAWVVDEYEIEIDVVRIGG